MALKFFGANRMAAQQGAEDRGTSLVSRRPSWGLGPQGMPGSSDYNPNPQRGAFMRDAGGSSTPNAYERGGFFWDGSGIRQGTPIAHHDQRLEHNEQDNLRRWATAALEDKRHGVNVRDVDARIRQADERIGHERGRLDLDRGRFDLDVDRAQHVKGLELGDRQHGRMMDRMRHTPLDLDPRGNLGFVKSGNPGDLQQMNRPFSQGREEQVLGVYQNYLSQSMGKRAPQLVIRDPMTGEMQIDPRGHDFISRLNTMMADPRFAGENEQEIMEYVARGAKFVNGDWVVKGPNDQWMRIVPGKSEGDGNAPGRLALPNSQSSPAQQAGGRREVHGPGDPLRAFGIPVANPDVGQFTLVNDPYKDWRETRDALEKGRLNLNVPVTTASSSRNTIARVRQ